jgi:hypothetical protein
VAAVKQSFVAAPEAPWRIGGARKIGWHCRLPACSASPPKEIDQARAKQQGNGRANQQGTAGAKQQGKVSAACILHCCVRFKRCTREKGMEI